MPCRQIQNHLDIVIEIHKPFIYAMGSKKLHKLEILKIKDLKTKNRDRKKSK